ncbi:MAG TPA: efflux RND transporter periplasmic adaptor subunit [Kofleriaceae bacterium]|nr:efflux RND transporter periplasmic adaptor subunit [Kofleriaceae bacterium]
MTRAVWAMLAFAACNRGETRPTGEVQPEDEVWLSPQQMEKANIRVAEVKRQAIAQAITVGGKVAFDDLHVTHVFSPVTGRVTRVLAKPGERVKKGAPLVAILSPDVGAAFSDVVKAQADLQTSELDFRREERLLGQDATSQRSFEAAQDTFRRATAEYERAKQRAALLRGSGLDLVTQEYMLRSFIDGEVIARIVNPGMEVAGQYSGGNSLELFTIGDIKNVWVYADVQDVDLPKLKVGQDVEVSVVAYPGRVFKGTIDLVASTVDPSLRTGRVRCSLPNEREELKPEMFATVSIVQPPEQRIAVPRDAVVSINETSFVYVQNNTRDDGRIVFKRRSVRAGDERDGSIPILDGVQPGERVVIEGSVTREQPNDEVWPTPKQIEEGHITTAKVATRDIAEAVTIGGRLAFDDTRISHVFSPVNGRITKVLAQPGQRVAKGAPLAAIVSPDLGSYLADVAKAEADATQAEHEYARQKELYDAGVGAKRDLEAAEDALRKAKAELERAKQLTQLLQSADFDKVTQEYLLRSPIAGEVISRKANPGLEVQGQYSNGGSSSNVVELFTIGELGELWMLGDVYEMDLPRVTEGDEVALRVDVYPDTPFHGRVDWVADVLDPVQHTAKVRCVIDNSSHLLRPEMYERVDIAVPGKQLVVVPRAAVMRVDGETIVFVQTGEKKRDGGVVFKRRKVVARLDDNSQLVPVLSGLEPGEVVAVDHSLMLLGML